MPIGVYHLCDCEIKNSSNTNSQLLNIHEEEEENWTGGVGRRYRTNSKI